MASIPRSCHGLTCYNTFGDPSPAIWELAACSYLVLSPSVTGSSSNIKAQVFLGDQPNELLQLTVQVRGQHGDNVYTGCYVIHICTKPMRPCMTAQVTSLRH